MMKKFLVLMLIGVLATMANAAIFLSIDGVNASDGTEDVVEGGTVTVYIMDDTGGTAYTYYLDMLKADGSMTTPAINSNAGNIAQVNDYSTGSLYDFEVVAADSGGAVLTGVHFDSVITPSGSDQDTFVVDLIDYGVGNVDSITFTIIPEPMTVALLGLGGLFLRRRK